MVFLLFAWSPIIWDPNTGVGSQSLLQGVLPTQGSNLVLQHCKEATMEAYLIITATNLLLSLRVSPLLNMHRSFTPSSYHSFFLIIYLWIFLWKNMHNIGFTGGSVVKKKKSVCQCRRHKTWFWSLSQEDPLEEEKIQYSCLKIFMDRGALWAIVHHTTKSQTWLTVHTHTHNAYYLTIFKHTGHWH